MLVVPRDLWPEETRKLCPRAHAHWQQAGLATDLPDWNATYSARLHCRQDTPATRILSRPEDAAVFVHSNPDRCVNHRTPGTKRSCAIHAVRTRSARTSSFTLSACWKSRTDHGRPRLLSCHAINGRGGDMAPDLTWEGSSVQRKWLEEFFQNPGTLRPALIRRMPRFNLTMEEISTLSDYIMTVYQTSEFERDSMPDSGYSPSQIEQGKQLFYSKYACQSCHIVDPKTDKGYIGPTLTAVGSRLTGAWVYHWLKNPQALRPGTTEPNRNVSDEEANSLTAFLMTQKGSGKREAKK
ncbi:MAG: hypothetical protein DMG81_14250 [Acidobacteria bacterium]|nr:MAG: hypothetical protein DMG81_14250 [Acidobacteriota bacterium]